jgi:FkbM family methyltransferase
VPRIASLGHQVTISAPFSYSGAPLHWRQFEVLPGGLEPGNVADLLGGHYRYAQADICISLCDGWVMDPGLLAGMNTAHWVPVDCTPLSAMDKVRLAWNTQLIAMSHFGQEQLTEAGLESLYVPHGVDTKVFSPPADRAALRERMDISPDTFIIGILAANKDQVRKSFPEQMRAFAEFHAKHPDSLLALHTAIEQPTGHRIKHLADNLGITDQVLYPDQHAYIAGLHTPPMLAEWYGALDLLSNCSYGEGFGVPVIEAQACGTPVVVTDGSTMPQLCGAGWKVKGEPYWAGGHEAWWVRPTIAGIARAYEQAWQAREDGKTGALRAKARQFALRYDADAVLARYWVPALRSLEEHLSDPNVTIAADLRWKVDDGAHVGHYTLRAAAKGANVIAIEANRATALRLAENLELNELQAAVHNVAAWDAKTTLKLQPPGKAERDGSTRVVEGDGDVPALPLDDLLGDVERIDVVKLDVEGADLHALRGMAQTLARLRPLLFIEDHSIYGYYKLDQLLDLLDELGYDHDPAYHWGGCAYWLARPREEGA